MQPIRPRRSRDRALAAIRAHFRSSGCSPSLSDLSRALICSRQRAWELVRDLERVGAITRVPGQAFGIRLIGAEPGAELSDVDVLYLVQCRGLLQIERLRAAGVALRGAIPAGPLTTMELPDRLAAAHLLAKLDAVAGLGDVSGEAEAAQDGVAGEGGREAGDRGAAGVDGGSGDGGAARRAA